MGVIRASAIFGGLVLSACSSSSSDPSAPAATVLEWSDAVQSIDLQEGVERAIPLTIRALDVGRVKVETVAPEGIEARVEGQKLFVRAAYNLGGELDKLKVTLDDGAKRTDVAVELRVKKLAWLRRTEWNEGEGPPEREHGVFFLDADSRAAYMFQGSGFKPQWEPIADSWKFDLGTNTWTSWTPSGDAPPEPIAAGRAAQARGSSVAHFFGGYTGWNKTEKDVTDLYRVDVKTGVFTKLAQSGAPPARQLHAFVSAGSDRLVTFGGFGGDSNIYRDTWVAKLEGDRASWTLVSKEGPSARYGMFYGVDESLQRLVVWSGAQQPKSQQDVVNAASDAWALDLASDPPKWSKLQPQGTAPKGRRNGCSMFDPIGHRLFVFGGTPDGAVSEDGLFVLDVTPGREAWTKLVLPNAPPVRSSGFGFVDDDGNAYCGFGNDDLAYADMLVLGYPK